MNDNKPIQNLDTIFQHAIQLHQAGSVQEAINVYENIFKSHASHLGVKTMLGSAYVQVGKNIEGIKLLKSALGKDPKQYWAHNTLGVGLLNLNRYQEAFFSFNKAIALKPDFIEAYFNLGKTLRAMHKYKEAIANYSKCISLNNLYMDAYNNRGIIYLEDVMQYEEAISDFMQCITLDPELFFAYYNLGNALNGLKRFDHAVRCFDRAIELKPDYAEAYRALAKSCRELMRYEDALFNYDRAIAFKPDYAEAYKDRGCILAELKHLVESHASYEKALAIEPDMHFVQGTLFDIKMYLCDWRNFYELLEELVSKILLQKPVALPFSVLALIDNPALQKKTAEIYAKHMHPSSNVLKNIIKYTSHKKIRIGYFSADFREHPVSLLTAELFELHDRNKFEVIAFSFGENKKDSMRKRLEIGFDQFIDVVNKTDKEVAMLAREMELDIAVDLGGFTQGARISVFAMRAAPIQMSYIGYLGTLGTDYFDYLIADSTLIPQKKQQHYSEKIIYLPTYQVNDNKREVSDKIFTREEAGLPPTGFIFCCFNNNYKILPTTFDGWMRILKAVDNSVLWVLDANDTATKNLRNQAISSCIDGDRIIFGKHVPQSEYLARYRTADLFLDTFPYNAGATASDALRMGLPLLTLMGESFASRYAASILNAVNLPELITETQEQYEALAIELAQNHEQFNQIRNKLNNNLPTTPLFNTKLFARNIEAAYQEAYNRYQGNLAADHIYIENSSQP